jgi:hypothetical protein
LRLIDVRGADLQVGPSGEPGPGLFTNKKVESGRSRRKPLEQAVPIEGKCAEGLQQGVGLGVPTPCSILDKPEAHFPGLRGVSCAAAALGCWIGFSERMARFDPHE